MLPLPSAARSHARAPGRSEAQGSALLPQSHHWPRREARPRPVSASTAASASGLPFYRCSCRARLPPSLPVPGAAARPAAPGHSAERWQHRRLSVPDFCTLCAPRSAPISVPLVRLAVPRFLPPLCLSVRPQRSPSAASTLAAPSSPGERGQGPRQGSGMARRVPQSLCAPSVSAERQRGGRSPHSPGSLRAGWRLPLHAMPGAGPDRKGERQAAGQGRVPGPWLQSGVLSPVTGFHLWQPCPGQRAREASTASPLLPRNRRPGPGRSVSGTCCGPGRHRAGAAPPVPSSPDPQAPRRDRCPRGWGGLGARPRPLPQPRARRGKRDPPAAPGPVTGPGPHEAQAPSQRGRARLGATRDRSFPSTAPSTRGRNESGGRVRHSPRHCPEVSAAGAPGRAHGRDACGCPRPGAEALPARPPAEPTQRSRYLLGRRRASPGPPELSAAAWRSR